MAFPSESQFITEGSRGGKLKQKPGMNPACWLLLMLSFLNTAWDTCSGHSASHNGLSVRPKLLSVTPSLNPPLLSFIFHEIQYHGGTQTLLHSTVSFRYRLGAQLLGTDPKERLSCCPSEADFASLKLISYQSQLTFQPRQTSISLPQ